MLSTRPSLDYSPSFQSSMTASTGVPSSDASPNLESVFTLSTTATSTATSVIARKGAARRSLSLLGKLPKDLSSLIRSHSASRRQSACLQSDHPKVVFPDYADMETFKNMQSTEVYTPDDDRPTRKAKKTENRFYNFLTGSRSRSRSKAATTTVDIAPVVPELDHDFPAQDVRSHSRHSSMGAEQARSATPSSKRSNVLPSRPISSNTNTTITPGSTPKASRRLASSAIPVPKKSTPTSPDQPLVASGSRPTTPKGPSSTRKKLHTLFGIPLSSSRKSSFSSSRAPSPGPSHQPLSTEAATPPPPLPSPRHFEGRSFDRNDPNSKQKLWTARVPTPPSTPRQKRPTTPQEVEPDMSTSTAASVPSKVEAHHRPSKQLNGIGIRVSHPRPKASTASTHTSSHIPTSSPAPTPRGSMLPQPTGAKSKSDPLPSFSPTAASATKHFSSTHRRAMTSPESSLPTPSRSGPAASQRATPLHAPQPRVITSPKELSGSISGASGSSSVAEASSRVPSRPMTSPPRLSQRKDSMDSGYRYRPMAIVDEERGSGDWNEDNKDGGGSASGNSTVKSNGRPQKTKASKTGIVSRGTKHGSFDFERPGWSAGGISRSISNNTASTSASGGLSQSKESLSNSTGGAGSLQKSLSLKENGKGMGQSNANAISLLDRRRRQTPRTPATPVAALQTETSTPSAADSLGFNTRGTPAGQSASLGRFTGKRTLGSGIARLVGISHGPFAFEPPVPSPTFSVGTKGGDAGGMESAREKERARRMREREEEKAAMKEKEKEREKEKKRAARRTAQVPVPVPEPALPNGYRSGTKGRSLDLGLGLAWAPTKMREDALLPSTFALGKSLNSHSASSRNGLRRNEHEEEEVDRSKIGKEVAEVFRSVLDEDGYAAFKNYVHRFDAHEIPFDGPTGVIARAERLLDKASSLTDESKRRLLDNLVRIILQNA